MVKYKRKLVINTKFMSKVTLMAEGRGWGLEMGTQGTLFRQWDFFF